MVLVIIGGGPPLWEPYPPVGPALWEEEPVGMGGPPDPELFGGGPSPPPMMAAVAVPTRKAAMEKRILRSLQVLISV